MSTGSIEFIVVSYSFNKKAGKTPTYKVNFKAADGHGHVLTLVSDNRSVYEGFPIGDRVDVNIGRAQKTIDEVPEE